MSGESKGYDLIHRIPAEIGQRTRRYTENETVFSFMEQGDIGENDEVLEVGSNLGWMSGKIFDKFGCSVTGIEPNPSKVTGEVSSQRGARRGKDVILEQADVKELPYDDETYKVVNIGHVLEHFTDGEIKQALAEIRRVLKENGIVIVSVPRGGDIIANATSSGHIQKFKNPEEVGKLLEDNGFDIVGTKDTGYSFVVSGKKFASQE